MDTIDRNGITERLTVTATAAIALTAAVTILLFEGIGGKNENAAGRMFQRTVCGLGIGSALRPDWGFAAYDPRVDAADETSMWPVPGGYGYSPVKGMIGESEGSRTDYLRERYELIVRK